MNVIQNSEKWAYSVKSDQPATGIKPLFRKALRKDVDDILELLRPFVEKQIVLPRNTDDIAANIDSFEVAEWNGYLIACGALQNFGGGLFEIRSLVVHPQFSGLGIGSELIDLMINHVKAMNGKKVFTLTLRPGLFLRFGFEKVDKNMFPEKVWKDCSQCDKKESCDEIALLYHLTD